MLGSFVERTRAILRHPASRAAPLAALLVWAPLPFASVTPGWSALLRAASLAVLALAVAAAPRLKLRREAGIALAALALLLALAWLQSVPLPAGLVSVVDPARARLAAENAALPGAPAPGGITLSRAPAATRLALGSWLAVGAAFAAAHLLGSSRRARRLLLTALVAIGLFELFFGAQLWFARSDLLWGVRVPGPTNRLRGTFVNANHLATYLAILVAAAFAWLWWSLRRARAEASLEHRIRIVAPAAAAWVLLFVGLAFTASRAGLLAALAASLLQGAIVLARRGRRAIAAGLAALLVAAVGSVALFGFRAGFGRLLDTGSADGSLRVRVAALERTLELWQQSPWTGVGLGAFRASFPQVQDASIPDIWWHAHNGWAELLATAGGLGFALFAGALWAVGRGLGSVWRRGERSEDRAAALAAIGALVAVGVQELGDFGITMPATALTLAVLCGAALAAAVRQPVSSES